MSILLLILKILGIIILCALGIVLLVILTVCLVPFRYRIQGSKFEDTDYSVRVTGSFLLKLIKVVFSYENKATGFSIYLFGKKLKDKKEDESAAEVMPESKTEAEPVARPEPESKASSESEPEPEIAEQATDEATSDNKRADNTKTKNKKRPAKTHKENKTDKDSFLKRFEQLRGQIEDNRNQHAVRFILLQVKRILISLKPRKIKGEIAFGLKDPALTGEITGFLALLPIVYQKHFHVFPSFDTEENYVDGEIDLSGYFQVQILINCAVRILFTKDCRRLITILIKKGEE